MTISRRRFLGRMAMLSGAAIGATSLSLTSCDKEEEIIEETTETDAVVIGSGFGGAVSSLRLSEAGIKNTVIEKGKFYDVTSGQHTFCTSLKPDKRASWKRNYTTLPFGPKFVWAESYVGLLDMRQYDGMKVYQNVCLGGGSISNGGVLLEPTEEHFKACVLADDTFSEIQPYFSTVRQMLDGNLMPEDLYDSDFYQFSRLSENHALNAGLSVRKAHSFYDWNIWRKELNREIERSALKGELIYGCNNGIKNSLDRNYLAESLGTGNCTIETLTQVVDIVPNDGRYDIHIERLNLRGDVIATKIFRCKWVFLCAGSIGSSELLVRCRERSLPDLVEAVGTEWGTNGNSFAMRSGLNEPTGNIHASPPTLAIEDYTNPISPLTAMQDVFPVGIDLRTLLLVGLVKMESRGHFTYNASKDKVELIWPHQNDETGVEAMKNLVGRLNSANGGKLDYSFIKSGVSKDFTYHPLGGIPMGKATDAYGRVMNYDNLYVQDGSLLPGSSGLVNPALTIAALCERNMAHVLRKDFT